ncbi:MAG TPA: hypothetical protein PKX00_01075 [Opitutaceae bacterium]|nr:hypothetical protein [Opitutaceae bacterium]
MNFSGHGKGTYFVHGPFIRCPTCGKDRYGVLMICNRHYVRRCKDCTHDAHIPLPRVDKKVIYLDQFVISNMMKELDPAAPAVAKGTNQGFYRTLFERLDRLCKLQLIVCPDSPVQHDESVVDPRFEKLRRVFRHFSHGSGLESPGTIFHAQLLRAFSAWRGGPPEPPLDRAFALNGRYSVWNDRLRIDLNYTLPGLADSLRGVNERRTVRLRSVCAQWQRDTSFSFQAVVDGEARELVHGPWRQWQEFAAHYAAAQVGKFPADKLAELLPMDASSLVAHMLSELKELPTAQRFETVARFFDSDAARAISFVRISALFWASLARDVRAGRKAENFPTGSLFNDVDVVAAYAPFCDAMFVDKQVSHLAAQGELKRELSSYCCLFSFRQGEHEQFLDYLANIERSASPEHLAKVTEVYGADWPTPYLDLLARTD